MGLAILYYNNDELVEIKKVPFRGEGEETETIKVEKEESA